MTLPPVGLYGIGMRGPDPGEMLAIAAAESIPYLHLRGGPRGYDLGRADPVKVAGWARQARLSVPVTMVTSDTDLSAFFAAGSAAYHTAASELGALADAAAALGARSVRLLSRALPQGREWNTLRVPDLTGSHGLLTLVELHDREWFTPASTGRLHEVLDATPWLAALLDTAQADAACQAGIEVHADTLDGMAQRAAVMHISDSGSGLGGTGHHAAARATARALAAGHQTEVAFEWTGPDRTRETCLDRYHEATAWWRREWEATA